MYYKKNLISLSMLVCYFQLFASPASPDSIFIKQPDGTDIWLIQRGDEWYNWVETTDGLTVCKNEQGIWEYASILSSNVACSGIKAHSITDRTDIEKQQIEQLQQVNKQNILQYRRHVKRNIAKHKQSIIPPSSPVVGERKLLTILIDFSDKPFTYSKTEFDDLLNKTNYNGNGNEGSVKDYYLANSFNQLTISSEVYGIYRAPQVSSYYKQTSENANSHLPYLLSDAIKWVSDSVNFADFDADNDGYVDGIHFIFAGNEASTINENGVVWPFMSYFYSPITKNG